jgi:hypothetical protein
MARRARHWVSVSSYSIVPSQMYSENGLRQSASGLGGPTMVSISPTVSQPCPIVPAEVPGLALEVRDTPYLPSRVLDAGARSSSPKEIPGTGGRTSSSSRMEGLNKSCINMPGGGGSRLDSSQARALATSLSRQRIWWSMKPSIFSSHFLTSYQYSAMRESRQFDSPMTWLMTSSESPRM